MKQFAWIAAVLSLSLLTGCGKAATTVQFTPSTAQETTEKAAAQAVTLSEASSDLFTNRDFEVGYDAETCTTITFRGTAAEIDGDGAAVQGTTVTITEEGTYLLTGSYSDGMVIVEVDESEKVQLVLDGVSIHSSTSAPIYVRQADKVFLTTTVSSVNTLSCGDSFTAIDENNIDSVIFSKSDLTLNGQGMLIVNAPTGHGIVSKDDLAITSGTYDITAASHGLSGKDSVRIAGGSFTITAGEDGIHGKNEDDESLGFVYLQGGTIQISAGDDGIHASGALTIEAGTITVTDSYEAVEGKTVEILGGELDLTATDDGINASGDGSNSRGTSTGDLLISGGTVIIHAGGDAMDANGSLEITGGSITISGPNMGDTSILDYDTTGIISGGTFLAAGASSMAQNFSDTSTQGVIMVSTETQSAGTVIKLTDASGSELLRFEADQDFSCVIVSCAAIQQGSTYTLTIGQTETSVTMDTLVYGTGGMGGRGQFGGGKINGGTPPEGMGDRGQMTGGTRPDGMGNKGQMNGTPPQMGGDAQTMPDAVTTATTK